MVLRRVLPVRARRVLGSGWSRLRWAPTNLLRWSAQVEDGLRAPDQHVALTFDDGPHPSYTPAVLDVLAAFGVRATFFVVGERVQEHPELVRRIRQEGHGLGSHSMSHPDARAATRSDLHRDYAQGRAALEAVVGGPVDLFRPPNGTLDVKGARVMRRLGLTPRLWTVDAEDWHPDTTADDIVLRCSHAGAGDVVLLHDGLERPLAPRALDRSATLLALPRVIEDAAERGLSLVTVPT